MKKAASQLSTICDLLTQPGVERELYRRVGWDLPPALKIITCIVSCNGMFPGLSIDGHPVRRLRELRNVVQRGKIRLGSVSVVANEAGTSIERDGLIEHSLWTGPELTPDILRKYIDEEWITGALFRAMTNVEMTYRLDEKRRLSFSSFVLNAIAAAHNLQELLGGGQ